MKKKLSSPPQIKSVNSRKKGGSGKLIITFFLLSVIFFTAYLLIPANEDYKRPRLAPVYAVFKRGMYDSAKTLINAYKDDRYAQFNDSLYLLESEYYLKRNDPDSAILALKKGISATDSLSFSIYFKLGKLQLSQGETREALNDFFNGLVLYPTNDSAWYYCGYIQATQIDDYENAIKSFEQALILNPEYKYSFNILLWRGISFQQIGDQTRAIRQFDQAIKLTSDNDLARYYKCKSLLISGDTVAACQQWHDLNNQNFELAKLALDAYCL